MPLLISEADVLLADPGAVAAALIEHMREHDVKFATQGARTIVEFYDGFGVLEATGDGLKLRVEAPDRTVLEILRAVVAEHVLAFAGEELADIEWRGDTEAGPLFSDFREMRLERAVMVAPRMRRLTFRGDAARFASRADLHVRMYFPPDGDERPQWPRPGPGGRTIQPPDGRRPALRYYTVRRADVAAGEVDVDFFMHEDGGPGAAFAAAAREGALVGMAGPLGRAAAPAAFTLFAGDETAIPAIARMLEEAPATARGAALIEIDDARDATPLVAPAGVEIRWLERARAPAGSRLLVEAVRAAPVPYDGDCFVWAGCEISDARAIRAYLRKERGLGHERHLVVGYWEREDAAGR